MVKFDSEVYGRVYAMMEKTLKMVLGHLYHGGRLEKTIERWAKTAR